MYALISVYGQFSQTNPLGISSSDMLAHSRSNHVLHRSQHIHTMASSSPYTSPLLAHCASLSVSLEIVGLLNRPLTSEDTLVLLVLFPTFLFRPAPFFFFCASLSFCTLLCSVASSFCASFSFCSFLHFLSFFFFSLSSLFCSCSCSLQHFLSALFKAPARHRHQ